MQAGDHYKRKECDWKVKIIHFTSLEVCVEDEKENKTHNAKFLQVFSLNKFLKDFEPCN